MMLKKLTPYQVPLKEYYPLLNKKYCVHAFCITESNRIKEQWGLRTNMRIISAQNDTDHSPFPKSENGGK